MISIVITTYGDSAWEEMAWGRAYPSALCQDAHEIIVHHEPNMTIGPARNAAAKRTNGDYLVFLDADDELADGYVAAMTDAIAAASFPGWTIYHPAVSYIRKQAAPPLMRPIGDLRVDNFIVIGAALSRNLFNTAGGFSDYPHGFEDYSLWAKAWKAGATILPVPGAVYRAYINQNSKHRVGWRDRKWQVATHLQVQAELFPEGV